jgi:hypothetical protein
VGVSIRRRTAKIVEPMKGIKLSYDVFAQVERWRWDNLFHIRRAIQSLFDRRPSGRVFDRVIIEANL